MSCCASNSAPTACMHIAQQYLLYQEFPHCPPRAHRQGECSSLWSHTSYWLLGEEATERQHASSACMFSLGLYWPCHYHRWRAAELQQTWRVRRWLHVPIESYTYDDKYQNRPYSNCTSTVTKVLGSGLVGPGSILWFPKMRSICPFTRQAQSIILDKTRGSISMIYSRARASTYPQKLGGYTRWLWLSQRQRIRDADSKQQKIWWCNAIALDSIG